MRSSPRPWAAFLLLYGALLAWQVDRWLFTAHGIVSTWSADVDSQAVSAVSSAGLTQSFTMGADGLDGLWLRASADRGEPRGQVLVDLVALQESGHSRVERVALAAADLTRRTSFRVPFRPVQASRGRHYEVHVRHMQAEGGPAIELAVTRDDTLRAGRLFVDGVEQWGDLVFATSSRRATLPYWLHEVLRPWPAWVRAWPTIAAALLMFNGALAWACGCAVGLIGKPSSADSTAAEAHAARPAEATAVKGLPLATVTVVLVAVAGIAVAARPTGRYRSLDLIAALPEAHVETTWGALHDAISPEPVLFGLRIYRSIVAMPPSRISYTVDVPRDAVLRLGAAMRWDMWDRRSDGIEMRIHIEHAGRRTTAAALTLYPLGVPEHRRLFPIEVPLAAWAGQRIAIVLETTPERWGNAVNDVPVWTEPRIEWPRNPAAGTARVIPDSR